jgi:hypothetical protein
VDGLAEAAALPGVIHLSLDVGPGDITEPVVGNGSRHGRYVVAAASFDQALALADCVEQTLRITIDPAS